MGKRQCGGATSRARSERAVAVADAAGDGGGDAGCSPTEVSVVKVTTLQTLLEAGMGEGVGPAGFGTDTRDAAVDRG